MSARFSTSFRLSLLASLGLVPLACGGTTLEGGGPPGGSSPGGNGPSAGNGSSSGSAGTPTAGTGQGGRDGDGGSSCTSPIKDPVTGLVKCGEGYEHRPSPATCQLAVATGSAGGASDVPAQLPRATGNVDCATDASVCSAFELGYCHVEPPAARVCLSGCRADADCGSGFVCHCVANSTHGGECVRSDCQTDADCGAGSLCATGKDPCGFLGFSCFKAEDSCTTDADCTGGPCALTAGIRACFSGACGRPFLVEHGARVAPIAARSDWNGRGPSPSVEQLTPSERVTLTAHWTKLGQMEHASIAAFARFQLQLLALGAPPSLVEACNRALGDETRHTRLCFGLASAYAGRAIGPGPLDVTGSLDATALADVVELVLVEGCFGETSAALEARDAELLAADPVVREVYAQIAEDEQRHAELAFHFVSWALERGEEVVRARVANAIAYPPTSSPEARAVALPCLQALLDRSAAELLQVA